MGINSKKALTLLLATTLVLGACAKDTKAEKVNDTVSIEYSLEKEDIESLYYEVQKGDTLSRISKNYYGDSTYWKELAIFNDISDPDFIRKGQIIKIPTSLNELLKFVLDINEEEKIHVVQKGESIYEICKYYYEEASTKTMYRLATYNKLSNPDYIVTGQELKIPSKEKLNKVKPIDYVTPKPILTHYCDEHCYTEAYLYDVSSGAYLGKTRVLKPHIY